MKILNTFKSLSNNREFSFLLLACYCLFAAISIAATRIVGIPFILFWIFRSCSQKSDGYLSKDDGIYNSISIPVFLWITIGTIASIVGVDFKSSIDDAIKDGFYFLFPFAIVSLLASYTLSDAKNRVITLLSLICLGQGFASLRSVISATAIELKFGLPGSITESGQLVLVIPLLWALAQTAHANFKKNSTEPILLGAILVCLLTILSWRNELFPNQGLTLAAILTPFLVFAIYRLWKCSTVYPETKLLKNSFLVSSMIAMMVVTLIVNLKRGPWLGVAFALTLLGILLSRRLAIWTVGAALFALLLPPVQSRLLNSAAHFSIAGGRQEMWSIGMELAQRFPLGLGMKNAYFMQTLDPLIPPTHRHMHSNLLNVLVEAGWLGLAAFIWLFWIITKIGFQTFRKLQNENEPLLANCTLAITVALLGWQVAGLVEYNYGDGEIRMMTLFYVGIILYCGRFAYAVSTKNTQDK